MQKVWLSIFLITFPLSSIAEPLFWQVEKGNMRYIIFGSVHVGDKSMYPLPKAITDALSSSSGLIVEADIRKMQDVSYPEITMVTKNVLDTKQQETLRGLASLFNIDAKQLLESPPWATALALQMKQFEYLGYQASHGIDTHLMYKATAQNIPVFSLESLQFQIDLLTGQKDSGKELLLSALDEFDRSEDLTKCLIASWKAGDLQKLNQFSTLTEMSPELENAFISQRNLNWAEQLAKPNWSKKSKATYLVVVGTLHLIGENNLLTLLKAKGFKVTQKSKSHAANCEFEY
ncbi:TraB/GumN family protein [Vibrio pectenicida]|uniref:TraB/GumN family protein n=1 Tax=Vibrio pectenicida TaxID=62763 RepID=A0A7Y4ECD3_9VIBR|nr:TraB/GumN family protein [Vibrio pectenicida]NOH70505.1 TraB/GumN family protein [Vibrio pectenicida]